MTTTYNAGIARARDGSASAWAFDLPGCRAAAANVDDAKALLPVVVAEHLAWLRGHGEEAPLDEPSFEYVEDIEASGEWVFEIDSTAVTNEEIEAAVRHIGYTQADLAAVAKPLPPAVLEWKPPATAVKIDAIFDDVRTIGDMLEHLARTESTYYLTSLVENRPDGRSLPVPDVFTLFESTAERLRGLTEEQRGRGFTSEGPRGEMHWSARKLLRRIMAHRRFHIREIEQRLCWLTLGVPEILPVNRE